MFRSSLMGFNKQDVIGFVSRLSDQANKEKEKGEAQLSEEIKKNEELLAQMEELRQQNQLLRGQLVENTQSYRYAPPVQEEKANGGGFGLYLLKPEEIPEMQEVTPEKEDEAEPGDGPGPEPGKEETAEEEESASVKEEMEAFTSPPRRLRRALAVRRKVSSDPSLSRLDEIIYQLERIKAGEDMIVKRMEGLGSEGACSREEEFSRARRADGLIKEAKERSDRILGELESYVGRVKEEMEAFGARLKSSKDNASRGIDQLEKDLAGLVDGMSRMDQVMDGVIQEIARGVDGK